MGGRVPSAADRAAPADRRDRAEGDRAAAGPARRREERRGAPSRRAQGRAGGARFLRAAARGAQGRAEGIVSDGAPSAAAPNLLAMQRIAKEFSGVRVLHDVTLRVRRGEVHALLGENGAGKSTLVKILSGAIGDYEGEIVIDDEPVAIHSPREAERRGIAIIHQELNLVP